MPYLGGTSLAAIFKALDAVPLAQRTGASIVRVIDQVPTRAPTAPPADGPFRRGLEQASFPQAIAWIAACLADALHYAHARGLVHMDLKPSNVLITADGQPMLLDFHLARGPIAAGERVIDHLGGTPGWMSPEHGEAMEAVSRGLPVPRQVDGRTDVFALGLMLKEALAVPGSSRGPAAVFTRAEGVSMALADITRKCLAPLPRDRYHDANALAEDLRRELKDEPLRGVRNRALRERWGKWRRRHPGTLGGAVAMAGLVGLAVAGAVVVADQEQRAQQVRLSLADARKDNQAGRHDGALRALRRADEEARGLFDAGRLRQDLQVERARALRGHDAEELHRIADLVRSHYGIDMPSIDEAQSLARECHALWRRWSSLLRAKDATLPAEAEERIRTDLVEVVAVWADLRTMLAADGDPGATKRGLEALFDEAEALCGPRLALDLRRPSRQGREADIAAPRTPFEYYDLGRSHLRAGRIDEAATCFRRALDERPGDFWSNFYLGLCDYRQGRFHDALAAFRVCVALEPASAVCHYDLGRTREALGRIDEAAHDYTRALNLDPGLVAARLNRGVLAHKDGRHADAIADFDEALRRHPDRDSQGLLHYNRALALRALGDRAEALASAEQALRLGCQGARVLRDELR
jgi:Flp pilus assembly protein TadD